MKGGSCDGRDQTQPSDPAHLCPTSLSCCVRLPPVDSLPASHDVGEREYRLPNTLIAHHWKTRAHPKFSARRRTDKVHESRRSELKACLHSPIRTDPRHARALLDMCPCPQLRCGSILASNHVCEQCTSRCKSVGHYLVVSACLHSGLKVDVCVSSEAEAVQVSVEQ
jgi:hypothetical protein